MREREIDLRIRNSTIEINKTPLSKKGFASITRFTRRLANNGDTMLCSVRFSYKVRRSKRAESLSVIYKYLEDESRRERK